MCCAVLGHCMLGSRHAVTQRAESKEIHQQQGLHEVHSKPGSVEHIFLPFSSSFRSDV